MRAELPDEFQLSVLVKRGLKDFESLRSVELKSVFFLTRHACQFFPGPNAKSISIIGKSYYKCHFITYSGLSKYPK